MGHKDRARCQNPGSLEHHNACLYLCRDVPDGLSIGSSYRAWVLNLRWHPAGFGKWCFHSVPHSGLSGIMIAAAR